MIVMLPFAPRAPFSIALLILAHPGGDLGFRLRRPFAA